VTSIETNTCSPHDDAEVEGNEAITIPCSLDDNAYVVGTEANSDSIPIQASSSSAPVENSNLLASLPDNYSSVSEFLSSLETLPKSSLISLAKSHNIVFSSPTTSTALRDLLFDHITSGTCLSSSMAFCISFNSKVSNPEGNDQDMRLIEADFKIAILTQMAPKLSLRALRCMLAINSVQHNVDGNRSQLHQELKKFITHLKHGKRSEEKQNEVLAAQERFCAHRQEIIDSWPRLVGQDLKDKIIKLFHKQTSKEALSTFTCASCGEASLCTSRKELSVSEIDCNILKLPNSNHQSIPYPYHDGPLKDVVVEPAGVTTDENGNESLSLCKDCHSALKKGKVPALSMANLTYLGPGPKELSDLTVVEEAMIARCQSKCWVIQLKEEDPNNENTVLPPNVQCGVKGHIIIYPQQPSEIAHLLPPNINDVLIPICVLFIRSSPPSHEWLKKKAKPLCIRREKLWAALNWLKRNNPLYNDIEINHAVLDSLEDEQI
jgi:hypothetical protein